MASASRVKTIVVGVRNTSTANDAASQAAALAHDLGAHLHLVSAFGDRDTTKVGTGSDSWTFTSLDEAQNHMATLRVRHGDDLEITTAARGGRPAKVLCTYAEEVDADLIVVGSVRTQGIARVLGSVATDVLHRAPCSVLVAKTT